jgi:hypothetical protein
VSSRPCVALFAKELGPTMRRKMLTILVMMTVVMMMVVVVMAMIMVAMMMVMVIISCGLLA